MSEYNIFKLKFLTPIHLGNGKENYDFSSSELHSDTLTSALAAIKAQEGKQEDLELFLRSFTLSSAFPYKGDSYFLPKPIGRLHVTVLGQAEHEYRKKLKNVEFIEKSIWNSLIEGEKCSIEKEQIQSAFIVENNNKDRFRAPYCKQVNQRVMVPRNETDAVPFFFEWTYFDSDSGLYCLTDAKDELFIELKQLFERLGEAGIGTDKNIGGGKFEISTGSIQLPSIENANSTMILSLYIPTNEEMNQLHIEQSKYNLIIRGGYMAGSQEERFRHLWKKSIYMFNVGSLFPTTQILDGKIVNLRPEWQDTMHPVYRSGRPFSILLKIKDYE
ncbi:type III-A CRISPR-associated RAMP protein Csm4 [Bacteroides sp.]